MQILKFSFLSPISFELAGQLFILNFVMFVVIRAIAEYVPLPLPKYKSWNKLSFTHYVWNQIWTLYVAAGFLTLYLGDEVNSSTFTHSWQNRMNRPLTGANLYFHAYMVWFLSTVFLTWWFNINKSYGVAGAMKSDLSTKIHLYLALRLACDLKPSGQYWGFRVGALGIVAFFRNNVQAYAWYPGLKQSFLGKFETLNRLGFAISFLVIRCVLWNFWTVMLVPDLLKSLQSGGLCWQMVVCATIWGFMTASQFKQSPPVAKGLLGFVEEKYPPKTPKSIQNFAFFAQNHEMFLQKSQNFDKLDHWQEEGPDCAIGRWLCHVLWRKGQGRRQEKEEVNTFLHPSDANFYVFHVKIDKIASAPCMQFS